MLPRMLPPASSAPQSHRNFPIISASGNVIIWLSEPSFRGRKSLKNKDILSSGSHSHSMQSNAFSLISVSPVRSCDSDSTDYLYSPCSTASLYHFFISVIKWLLCCESRGLFPWSHYIIHLSVKQIFCVEILLMTQQSIIDKNQIQWIKQNMNGQ